MTKYRSYVTISRKRKKDIVLSVRWAKVRLIVRLAVRSTNSLALLMTIMRTLDPLLFVKNLLKRHNIGATKYRDLSLSKNSGFFFGGGSCYLQARENTGPCRLLIAVYIIYCLANVCFTYIYYRNVYLIIPWTL